MLARLRSLGARAAAFGGARVRGLRERLDSSARWTRVRVLRHTVGLRRWLRDVAWPLIEPGWTRIHHVGSFATGFGWGVVLATLGLGVLGAILVWHELTALAAIGACLLVLCAGFLFGRTSYSATLDLTRTRVVVGEQAVGAITIGNPSKHTLRPVEVALPVGKGVATFPVPRLAPGDVHEDLFRIPTHRRAVLPVGPIRAVRGDPLGVLARTVTWGRAVDLYVHPQTVSLDGSSAGVLQDLEGLPSKDLSSSDLAFHAIREYVPGDERRHVHWRSTARTGKLMVRQFEETRRSHLAVALSLAAEEYSSEEEFELGISVAGSVGAQALKEDRQLTVLVQGASLPTRTGKMFLDSLSGLDYTPTGRGGLFSVAIEVGAQVPDASVALLVCGTNLTPQQILRATSVIPAGVTIVAVYCEVGAKVALRTIGDASVLTVGDLRDLPRALRRVIG